MFDMEEIADAILEEIKQLCEEAGTGDSVFQKILNDIDEGLHDLREDDADDTVAHLTNIYETLKNLMLLIYALHQGCVEEDDEESYEDYL